MLFSKDAPKARRFRIWSICLLIIVVSASILFVVHVASRSSEPWISVSFVHTNYYRQGLLMKDTIIEVTNRMSFNVDYAILADWVAKESPSVSRTFREHFGYSIGSQKLERFMLPSRVATKLITYERQLKPIEASILEKLPWLKQHYPFNRRHTIFMNESVPDNQVSGK